MTLNNATLMGNLTHDPVIKTYGDNQFLTKFTIATNYKPKGKEEQVEYHNIVAFGGLAKVVRDFLKKGKPVFVQGRLTTSRWDDAQGVSHTKTEVISSKLLVLDKKQASVSAGSGDEPNTDATEAMVQYAPVQAIPQAA